VGAGNRIPASAKFFQHLALATPWPLDSPSKRQLSTCRGRGFASQWGLQRDRRLQLGCGPCPSQALGCLGEAFISTFRVDRHFAFSCVSRVLCLAQHFSRDHCVFAVNAHIRCLDHPPAASVLPLTQLLLAIFPSAHCPRVSLRPDHWSLWSQSPLQRHYGRSTLHIRVFWSIILLRLHHVIACAAHRPLLRQSEVERVCSSTHHHTLSRLG
jgi:hypothetical protein